MSIYLDYAAATPADERVVEAMCRCMRETCANPSSAYGAAGAARRELRLARQAVARMLCCDVGEVFFTSGGTESNSWALSLCAGGHAAVSAIEHASVLESARRYAQSTTLILPNRDGIITPEAVEAALRPDTALISVQWANNETGVIQPVEAISRIARKHRVPLHVDAVQAFGHVRVDARLCDMLSLSAHKVYGPRGAGCLYVRQGVSLSPLICGGGQESGLRAGTENVPAICGLRVACELAQADLTLRAEGEQALMRRFFEALQLPEARLLGENAARLPGVAAVLLPGAPSEQMIARLDQAGVEVSGGAACASRSHQPSHVYRAMGLSEQDAGCVIRISIGRGISAEAMEQAARVIREVYGSVR